jgi:hypothetical protein
MDGQEVVGRLNARALLTSTKRRSFELRYCGASLHGGTIASVLRSTMANGTRIATFKPGTATEPCIGGAALGLHGFW